MMAAERGAARATLLAYRRDLADLAAFAGGRGADLPAADEGLLRDYLTALSLRGIAPSTLARRLATIRQFFRFLFAEDVRQDDPTASLDGPRRQRPLPKVLSEPKPSLAPRPRTPAANHPWRRSLQPKKQATTA